MKLPILTPKELKSLEKVSEDRELLQALSADFDSSISFFEAAIDDDEWSSQHKTFLDQYVKWMTGLYYADELDLGISYKLYRLLLKYRLQIEPHLIKDIAIKVADKNYKANSIIAGHSSAFLRDQIRMASDKGLREVRLPEHHIKLAEFLFDSNRDLSGLSFENLINISVSAREIGIDDVAKEAETLAVKYVHEKNAFEVIKESHRLGLYELQKLSAEYYSRLNKGFSLSSEGKDLIVIFHDLKILTTLEEYKQIASITSGIGFRGDLGKDPEINTFIRVNPKVLILDLSQTTSSIPLESFPSKIHTLLLNKAEWLNAQELERFNTHFPNLRRLELEEVNYLSFDAFSAISLFTKVEELNMSGMRLNDNDFDLILSDMTGLKVINLSGLKKLGPRKIESVLNGLDLIKIDLSYTNADDALVAFLVNRMRKLEELNIRGSAVTPQFITEIKKKTRANIIT